MLLLKRNFLNMHRIPEAFRVRLFTVVFISVVMLLIYYDVEPTRAGIQNRNGALFFMTANGGM